MQTRITKINRLFSRIFEVRVLSLSYLYERFLKMSEASSSGVQGGSVKQRMEERMKKLRDLHLKRNEARQLNHAEVIEEDRLVPDCVYNSIYFSL